MSSLLESVVQLKHEVGKSKKYISSKSMKERLRGLYKESWVPASLDFKKEHGEEAFTLLENCIKRLFEYGKRHHVASKQAYSNLQEAEKILEAIEIETIRKRGLVIESEVRDDIVTMLRGKGFEKTVEFIGNAERELMEGKCKESCFQARLAVEELLRQAREKHARAEVKRGMLPNHINYFKDRGMISNAEEKLVRQGFYGFLSEKGGHATKEEVSVGDAQVSINIFYVLTQYIAEKLQI